MSNRNEHFIVIMLEAIPFDTEFEIWAQHITVVPWFPVADEAKLDKILKSIAARHWPFRVRVGDHEVWGKKEKYEVLTIHDEGSLNQLHLDIFNSLENNSFTVHQKDYLGDQYAPHIAIRNQIQRAQAVLVPGQEIKISSFSLVNQVRLKGSGRMIKKLERNYTLNEK